MSDSNKSKVTAGGLAVAAVVVVVAIKGLAVALTPTVKVADLKPYSDTAGAFSVKFPGQPKVLERPTSLPGVNFKMHAVERGSTVLAVAYYDIPDDVTLEGNEHKGMKLEIDGFAKSLKGKPAGAARQFVLQDEPAQEVRLETRAAGQVLIRMVIREDTRIYRIVYMSKDFDEAVAKAFVESFQMTGEL